jgi:hypothetical protein
MSCATDKNWHATLVTDMLRNFKIVQLLQSSTMALLCNEWRMLRSMDDAVLRYAHFINFFLA